MTTDSNQVRNAKVSGFVRKSFFVMVPSAPFPAGILADGAALAHPNAVPGVIG